VKKSLILLVAVVSGCTTGSVLLTGTPRPALAPEAVKVYSEIPAGSEVIGELSSTSADVDMWSGSKVSGKAIFVKSE